MTRQGWYWPIALGTLLAVSAGANIVMAVVASRDPSFAVENDYYRKALAWDQTMAQERRNGELGWSVVITVDGVAKPAGDRSVTARVTNRRDNPIDGAHVVLEALHNARAGHVLTTRLTPAGGGRYGAVLPIRRAGLWEFRVRVSLGDVVFTETLTRDVEESS